MDSIAHYNLLERIGEGGLGEVFRARDTRVGRTVALKRVGAAIADHPARIARLLEHAHAAMALSHPNVATLFDAGEADGTYYLAYEFASGRTLRDECGAAPMNPRRALDLAVQMADGVADAHAHGIIHGDLRPETIMVTGKGSAKILDFGLAAWTRGGRARADAGVSPDFVPPELTSVLAYLSPEQAIGGAVDPRTDVFTLGTIAYEMLTGRNPFEAGTPRETVARILRGKVVPASEVTAAAPTELDGVLARALTPDIAERLQSAAALAAELRSVCAVLDVRTGDVVHASTLLPIDDTPDRNAAVLLASALAAGAAAAVAVWWWLSR